MTDNKDADIRDALRDAGISEAALATAESEFQPTRSGSGPNGQENWTLGGSTTTVAKHARRYAEAHPFLCATGRPTRVGDKHRPRYADGSFIPTDQLSADDLLDIQARIDADKAAKERGPQPDYSQEIAEGRDRARKELIRDAAETHRQAEAKRNMGVGDGHAVANTPPGVAPEFAGLDGLTADELLDLAGEVK